MAGSTHTLETSSRLLIVLMVIVAVDGAGNNYGQSPDGKRSWTIAHGNDWGAYEYYDEKGYIQGFNRELIDAVCAAAGMTCYTIFAPYTQCWDSNPREHPFGGRGLMDGWFDACTGWHPTTDRIHVFSFGIPYVKLIQAHFYIKAGSPFDPTDLSGKKIGFLRGYHTDERCLARAESNTNKNYVLTQDQIIYEPTPEALVSLLHDGKIDAIFAAIDTPEKQLPGSQEVVSGLDCALGGGGAMMTRKDSGFLDEWNRGFQKLHSSGQFSKLCDEANQNHAAHGTINCVN